MSYFKNVARELVSPAQIAASASVSAVVWAMVVNTYGGRPSALLTVGGLAAIHLGSAAWYGRKSEAASTRQP